MKEAVQLICSSNSDYLIALCVMLVSVVENFDPERQLVIHIISTDISEQERDHVLASIRTVRPSLDHIEVHWHSLDGALLNKLPIPNESYFSRDTYSRLFAPHLLPEDCERAVYLDCDMVVLADISKLYDSTANHPAIIHAVHDIGCPLVSSPEGVFDYAERGIPADTRYFNGGILVINLKRWRERNLTSQMVDYLVVNGNRVHFVDQGALNAFLHHDWAPLDLRWNQPYVVLNPETKWIDAGYAREDWLLVKNDPYIVHYMGSGKPWLAEHRHLPRRVYFFRYLRKTVYKNAVAAYPYLESVLGLRVYYFLWRLKLRMFPRGLRPALDNTQMTPAWALSIFP